MYLNVLGSALSITIILDLHLLQSFLIAQDEHYWI